MVQGVGFRYTAASVAREFAVTGWVRNRSDGRVELTVEGKAPELERFLARLSDEMSGYIAGVDRNWQIATGGWQEFGIAPTE
jgi:acylphosphatase